MPTLKTRETPKKKPLTAKQKARMKERRRHRKYLRKVGNHVVFGKRVRSRMIRVSAKFADKLARKAKLDGRTITEYTERLARRA